MWIFVKEYTIQGQKIVLSVKNISPIFIKDMIQNKWINVSANGKRPLLEIAFFAVCFTENLKAFFDKENPNA